MIYESDFESGQQPTSFYFYDLETTGKDPGEARIVQFAGQRTDMDLQPTGEPDKITVRLADDVLPSPEAIFITGISPQSTQDGYSEAAFLNTFNNTIASPGTIFTGFNSAQYDDEVIRNTSYRNFYDPYEWHWRDGRSHWDLIDGVRMTRALRPDGIVWPVTDEGKPLNRLEALTTANGLEHKFAHDALSDVWATIAVAGLVKTLQPKMFDYLLGLRHKRGVERVVAGGDPFVHTSSIYPANQLNTSLAVMVAKHPKSDSIFAYDLTHDPDEFLGLTPEELADAWYRKKDNPGPRLPLQRIRYNRSPAVAPLGVLGPADAERTQLSREHCQQNFEVLQRKKQQFRRSLLKAHKILDDQLQERLSGEVRDVDRRMYDGFYPEGDRAKMAEVRRARPDQLGSLVIEFADDRLRELLPRYKARNYPELLTPAERADWDETCRKKLQTGEDASESSKFFAELSEVEGLPGLTHEQRLLLGSLRQYGSSILIRS